MAIIEISNLTKTFKRNIKSGNLLKDFFRPRYISSNAVENISFKIEKGESVAFLGPNGAGKTTTIKMLTGLIYPSSGEVNVLNFFPFDKKREFLSRIGLVMGNKAGLNWDLTPIQSFKLLKEIYSISDSDFNNRIEELSEILDTKKFLNNQVRKLSLGERMKMELIGAILHNPDILFLDEPTIGLDITSKKRIREFLREIQKRNNVTMLLTSHDMDDVEKVCDRVIVINKGKKIYDGNLDKLNQKYNKEKYLKFYFEELPNLSPDLKKSIIEKSDSYLLIKTVKEELPSLISKITSNYDVKDIDIISTPLEEIIEDLYQK